MLTDGTLFPLAALGIVLPLFLPIAVAITAGEAIAGEAQQGTLRYMLVRPVGRTRLLVAKLVAVMAFVVLTVLVVAATAYVLGVLLLGNESVTATGPASVSGSSMSTPELVGRTFLALGYAMLCMLGVAAVALFLSTVTESPLGAALARWRCWSPRRCCSPSTPPTRCSPTCRRATGWPSSTSSATRSCGATCCAACCCRRSTSWCSSAPAGPTS